MIRSLKNHCHTAAVLVLYCCLFSASALSFLMLLSSLRAYLWHDYEALKVALMISFAFAFLAFALSRLRKLL